MSGINSEFYKVYTDGRALEYISSYWSIKKTEQNIKWLNGCPGRTIKDCFLKDPEAAADFISFAADCESKFRHKKC